MDIHKPKAVHSLRDFLSEIVVVVCGILIALSLEEALRAFHDHVTAQEALEAVKGEVVQNLTYMNGRLATLPCVEKRLDEIADRLEAAGEGPMAQPPQWVGQPPIWWLTDQRWAAATASGRTSLLRPERQGQFAGLYSVMSQFNDGERDEQQAWAQLRGLESWRGPLGPAGRVHFLEALQNARYQTWRTRVTVGVATLAARDLGLVAVTPKTMVGHFRLPHAVCLPINTPRAQALNILANDGGPPWGQPK